MYQLVLAFFGLLTLVLLALTDFTVLAVIMAVPVIVLLFIELYKTGLMASVPSVRVWPGGSFEPPGTFSSFTGGPYLTIEADDLDYILSTRRSQEDPNLGIMPGDGANIKANRN